MAVLSKSFVDELRSRLRLSDLIGQRIAVSRKGREFQACCPFHNEKTPSFTINDEKEFFHCFGCGAHGDHIGFVMRHDNLPFMEAVELLAEQAGMEIPKATPQEKERFDRQDLYYKMMEDAAKFFTMHLFESKNADILGYLKKRDLTEETISAFRLGYAPDDGQMLRNYLKAKGYSDHDMVTLCLTKASSRGTQDYSFFRDRVMFPVMDKKGRVVAFGGRVLPDYLRPQMAEAQFTPPKYINSSETPLFHKGNLVYNISNARQAASDSHPLIVVEGYADVIAMAQAGFKGAVAPLGTALTETQISLLWDIIPAQELNGLREPILCFDGDNAGQRASSRAMERILPILKAGVSARFAFMPKGLDPDDLIRDKGFGAMQSVLDAAIPLHEMIWRHLTAGQDFARPEQRASFTNNLEKMIINIADRGIQSSYRQILKDKFYNDVVRLNNKSFGVQKNKSPVQIKTTLTRPNANHELSKRMIIGIFIKYPHFFDVYEEKLTGFQCENQALDALRQNVISILSDKSGITHEHLLEALEIKGIEGIQIASLMRDMKVHASYVFNMDAMDVIDSGLKELLDRVAV